jgi:hypothetical protein
VPTDPAVQCLDDVAAAASAKLNQKIARIAPRDTALTWKAASVHPLQALETEYQGIVHDAVRGIDDLAVRKTIESEALADFFFFDAAAPRLLGVGPGEAYDGVAFPLPEDKLRESARQLKAAAQTLRPPHGQPIDRDRLYQQLIAAYRSAAAVRDGFLTLPGSVHWGVPAIDAANHAFARADLATVAAQTTGDPRLVAMAIRQLKKAVAALEKAVAGLAAVQMIYFIEPFYLFRLLVRYRLTAEAPLTTKAIADASGALTALVTNGHPWLSEWLRAKIAELAARIAAVDPSGNTLFFLKGGRAVQYLLGTPENGENDWDTQIVINPQLPAAQWYTLFQRVSNEVLIALKQFKAEFYMLLHYYAADFERELAVLTAPPPPDPVPMEIDEDDAPEPMDIDGDGPEPMDIDAEDGPVPMDVDPTGPLWSNCKAELIDVGMPRNDMVEAHEQWAMLNPGRAPAGAPPPILVANGVPYPGPLYYIDEYVTMIREVFAGASASPAKATTRIKRLYDILQLPGMAEVLAQQYEAIPPPLLPQSLAIVSRATDTIRAIAVVLLRQFSEAYGLRKDPGLAAAFDGLFAANLADAAGLVVYPQPLAEAIQAQWGQGSWSQDYTDLATAIGYAQWVSQQMEAHFADRAAFMAGQQPGLDAILRQLLGNEIFSQDEEKELQIALRGSFAASLQSGYVHYPHADELDPVTYDSLGIYSPREDASPAAILELVAPLVADCLAVTMLELYPVATPDAIRIYWANDQTIGQFTYKPLAIEIVVHPLPARPLLSYIWGLALLPLRDLVLEYRGEAARTEEFGRRAVLRKTGAALTEMLTQAANPEPVNPALAALRKGECHHLMISNAKNANGYAPRYPASYYRPYGQQPYMAFQVTMTENRPALAAALSMPAAAVDRTLDLLVLNQGHGDIGRFDTWTSSDLRTYLVKPLVDAGVRARIIVLDFCVSASLIDVFAPLCAPDGGIWSALYSINQLVVTTDFWEIAQPALAQRDLNALNQAVLAQLQRISAGLAESYPDQPRCPNPFAGFTFANGLGKLTFDAALGHPPDHPMTYAVRTKIDQVDQGSGATVDGILTGLRAKGTVSILNQVPNFLQ